MINFICENFGYVFIIAVANYIIWILNKNPILKLNLDMTDKFKYPALLDVTVNVLNGDLEQTINQLTGWLNELRTDEIENPKIIFYYDFDVQKVCFRIYSSTD